MDANSRIRGVAPATVSKSTADYSAFVVPWWLDWLGSLVHQHPKLWVRAANMESRVIASELHQISITAPIYICGLARSGSTLLHEIVASNPSVATHRMKDFPFVFTPYWWRRATSKWRQQAARERAHGDRIMITADSPDALEEMLWMAFFPDCHDPQKTNVLGADAAYPEFASFYKTHLAKLLAAETATRYAAKANYHVARLAYLVRLFPNAKILLPVRAPTDHVASLLRQHERFCRGQREHPRALAYMQHSGHFEFGLDRRPLNLGDSSRVERVLSCWRIGDDLRGFALYWDMVYAYLSDLLARDELVRTATLIVRFETLCDSPDETLQSMMRHVNLPDAEAIIDEFASAIRRPTYYTSRISQEENAAIADITKTTARAWGYI